MHDDRSLTRSELALRTLVVSGVAAAVVLVLLLAWVAADVLLMVFAGILVAVLLRGLSDRVARDTPLGPHLSLAVVVFLLAFSAVVAGVLLAPSVANQIDDLTRQIPAAVDQLQERLDQYEWSRQLMAQLREANDGLLVRADFFARARGVFTASFAFLLNVVVIFFVGLFLTVQPRLYLDGLIRLAPPRHRGRVAELLHAVGLGLWRWLLGKILAMLLVGSASALGLWIIGVPLAMTLGILAGLLNFIPYLGPVLSAIPPLLVALPLGFDMVMWVLVLYVAVQAVESYALSPVIERHSVYMPPALAIFAQVTFGYLFGLLGILLATPLVATGIIVVKLLYLRDTLGEEIQLPGVSAEQTS
jgi:predicted PurR-regulated permease PerM